MQQMSVNKIEIEISTTPSRPCSAAPNNPRPPEPFLTRTNVEPLAGVVNNHLPRTLLVFHLLFSFVLIVREKGDQQRGRLYLGREDGKIVFQAINDIHGRRVARTRSVPNTWHKSTVGTRDIANATTAPDGSRLIAPLHPCASTVLSPARFLLFTISARRPRGLSRLTMKISSGTTNAAAGIPVYSRLPVCREPNARTDQHTTGVRGSVLKVLGTLPVRPCRYWENVLTHTNEKTVNNKCCRHKITKIVYYIFFFE